MIVITGASGLLGSSLVEVACQGGIDAVGLYHRHPLPMDRASMKRVKTFSVDLTDESQTKAVFDKLQPSAVIHCAAETNVDWCEEHADAAEALHVITSRRIAEITARSNARMLYVSTDAVFDGERGQYTEDDLPAPLNVYAETKLRGEQEVLARNPLAAVARVNLYGWNVQRKQSLAEWILSRLASGDDVPGFTDVIFCPTFACDLASILLAMLAQELVGTYHVVSSEEVSKFEFARRVASVFGFDPARVVPARVADARLKAPRPRNISLNTAKICAALGQPMPDVDAGLRRFAQLRGERHAGKLAGQMVESRS